MPFGFSVVVDVLMHLRGSELVRGVRHVNILFASHLRFVHLKLKLELKELQLFLQLLLTLIVLDVYGLLRLITTMFLEVV